LNLVFDDPDTLLEQIKILDFVDIITAVETQNELNDFGAEAAANQTGTEQNKNGANEEYGTPQTVVHRTFFLSKSPIEL